MSEFRGVVHDGCPEADHCDYLNDRDSYRSVFCPGCGFAWDCDEAKKTLRSVKMTAGRVGTSKVDQFLLSGDPAALAGGKTDQPPTGF